MANGSRLLLLGTALLILIGSAGCSHETSPASVIQNSSGDHFWHVLKNSQSSGPGVNHSLGDIRISANESQEPEQVDDHHNKGGIHVASWRWDEIGIYFTFTTFIIIAGLAKVGFHHAHIISSRVPESCLLILLGTAVGGILYNAGVGPCKGMRGGTHIPGCSPIKRDGDYFTFPTFTPKLFFLILLPPIILESSYSLYDRAFADNVLSVLSYAVIGTIFNTFVIGLSLLFLVEMELIGSVKVPAKDSIAWWLGPFHKLLPTECFVFSSLISAVDPVAVLAIFQEVGINKDLYFLVFGESLLNDAVTVVLYTMMVAFSTMEHISGPQIALGLASFFTSSFGGLSIGIISGLITALITRTTSQVRVVEPLAVLGMAYLSYLSAELFHFSGIISTIGCGLIQAHYSFANISHKSYTTVKYFIKMLSSTSDAIIFLFLGMVLINDVHQWDTGFVLWTLFLCFTTRFIGVFLLTAVINQFRLKPIDFQEQFIMAYGGLRGAVSFSLVEMLEPSAIRPRQMFVSTTLAVIIFTVFIQGGTIKPLVRLLNIQMESKKTRHLTSEINETMIYHLTAGMEEICGKRGNNYIRERIEYLDERYLRPIFTRTSEKSSLQRLFEKLTISEHYANMYAATGPTGMTPVSSTNNLASVAEMDSVAVEATPLLADATQSSVKEAVEANQRPLRKGLGSINRKALVRQQSAPPTFNPPPSAMSTSSNDDSSEFSDVQLRRKGSGRKSRRSVASSGESEGSSVSLDAEATDQAFRKALRSSSIGPYKRVYQKHNRNLIGEDEGPEELMELALRRQLSSPRTQGTGRFAAVVASIINSPQSSTGSMLSNRANSELGSPIRQSSFENQSLPTGSIAKRSERRGSTTRPKTSFAPLRVINERVSERKGQHSTLEIQDVDDEEDADSVFDGRTTTGSMETGV